MTAPALKALIEQIVDGLLVNGSGQKADRLVLMQDEPKRDLGGWCRAALYDRIYYPVEAVLSTEPQASDVLGYDGLIARIERHLEDVMSPTRTHLLLGEASTALQRAVTKETTQP